jgi:hypothetical protein
MKYRHSYKNKLRLSRKFIRTKLFRTSAVRTTLFRTNAFPRRKKTTGNKPDNSAKVTSIAKERKTRLEKFRVARWYTLFSDQNSQFG